MNDPEKYMVVLYKQDGAFYRRIGECQSNDVGFADWPTLEARHAKTVEKMRELIDKQGAEIAELRKDAERYRWLRSQHWSNGGITVVANSKDAVRLGHDCPSHERLDAAIDKARAIRQDEATKQGGE